MAKKKSSSTGKSLKKAVKKEIKKAAKKKPGVFIAIVAVVLVVALAISAVFLYQKVHTGGEGSSHDSTSLHSSDSSSSYSSLDSNSESTFSEHSSSEESEYISLDGDSSPLSIHFIEQDAPYTGDLIYIKAGENDIVIDGGARKGVAATATSYIDNYVTDGKLEYVIATHAHQDHIAGLVGNADSSAPGGRTGILYHYKVDTLIDFSYYISDTYTHLNSWADGEADTARSEGKITQIYRDYLNARDHAISQGATHYLASELTTEGNNWTIELGTNLTMTLLYNFFYDHTKEDVKLLDPSYSTSDFSDQNDCSVALLLSQGNNHMLFTGDCEEYAEASIVKFNSLPKVKLFKAGHHGSYTASSDVLLDAIDPDLIVCCCCAGNKEYASNPNNSFPAQAAINRFAKHTDRVYVTTLGSWEDKNYHTPMNGDVVVKYDVSGQESVTFSHNDTKLKDTAWFKANRTTPPEWTA